jgi:hypothetical protein
MSRKLTLSGLDLWDNALTGLGTITPAVTAEAPNRVLSHLPRTRTHLVKEHGGTGAIVRLTAQYTLSPAQYNSLAVTIQTAYLQLGSLVLPDGRSWSNVILTQAQEVSRGYERVNGGVVTQRVGIQYEFFQVRA